MPLSSRTWLSAFAAGLMATHAAVAAPTSNSGAAKPGIKCWTNSEGVRECGNAVPAEYSQQESRTLNRQGITIEKQQRAKTAQELAQEAKNKSAEDGRLAEEERKKAEQKRVLENQAKADHMLLSTFASERDITDARDRKISALEGSIEVTAMGVAKQQQKVESYQKRIAAVERTGKPAPDDLKQDMALEKDKLDKKQAYIAAKRTEIEAIKAEYEGYLSRFRELKQ